ncbi:MAG: hypothetical protein U0930_18740 [Pirellulales bacterium]
MGLTRRSSRTRRNTKRGRISSRPFSLLSAILLESIALIAVVTVARPDLIRAMVARLTTNAINEAQIISGTPYIENIKTPPIAFARPQTALSNQAAVIVPNFR